MRILVRHHWLVGTSSVHGHHPLVLFKQSRPMTFAAWAVIGFFMVLSAVDSAYGAGIGTALGDCAIFGLVAGLVACALHVDLRVAADRLILNGWFLTTVIPMGSVVAVHGDDGLYVVVHEGRYGSSVFQPSLLGAAAGYPRSVEAAQTLAAWIEANGVPETATGRPRRRLRASVAVPVIASLAAAEIVCLLAHAMAG